MRFRMSRPKLISLTPLVLAGLLAGCVNESASYLIDGRDHAVTVFVTQDVFWSKQAGVRVVASHLPDCQRRFDLGKAPLADFTLELFSTGPETYLLRAGDDMWQVETVGCTQLPEPSADVQAQPIGVFHFDARKNFIFERADGAAG